MLNIDLDISQVEAGLGRLLANTRDTRPMMRGIATELLSLTEDNFENESWGGEKWPQSRRAAETGGKTLQKKRPAGGKYHRQSRQQLRPHRQQQSICRHPPFGRQSRAQQKSTHPRPSLLTDEQ